MWFFFYKQNGRQRVNFSRYCMSAFIASSQLTCVIFWARMLLWIMIMIDRLLRWMTRGLSIWWISSGFCVWWRVGDPALRRMNGLCFCWMRSGLICLWWMCRGVSWSSDRIGWWSSSGLHLWRMMSNPTLWRIAGFCLCRMCGGLSFWWTMSGRVLWRMGDGTLWWISGWNFCGTSDWGL